MSAESRPVSTAAVIGLGFTDCAAAAPNLCENDTYRSPDGKTGMSQTEGQVCRCEESCTKLSMAKRLIQRCSFIGKSGPMLTSWLIIFQTLLDASSCVCYNKCKLGLSGFAQRVSVCMTRYYVKIPDVIVQCWPFESCLCGFSTVCPGLNRLAANSSNEMNPVTHILIIIVSLSVSWSCFIDHNRICLTSTALTGINDHESTLYKWYAQ